MNETRLVTSGHADLVEAYAEMVVAFARLVRPRLLDDGETVRVAVMDHLLDRLTEARTGLSALSFSPLSTDFTGNSPGTAPGFDSLGSWRAPPSYETLRVGFPSLHSGR